jgi:hypothetical protein
MRSLKQDPKNRNNVKTNKNELSLKQRAELFSAVKDRFEKNLNRHKSLDWAKVQAQLEARPDKLWSLAEMERTGGEPDVVGVKSGEFLFMDCSAQSPKGRVSFCYDHAALAARKEHKPENCVLDAAAAMGVDVLTEEEYFALQQLGEFDTKSSSWLRTPAEIRQLGGAIYGNRRYNRVFIGHNGAESYYSGRGFRGLLKV